MNILFVIESLSRQGGAENALVNQCIYLKEMGHDISIIHLWSPNDFKDILDSKCIDYLSIGLSGRWNLIRGAKEIRKFIKKKKPDVINAINFFPMAYVSFSRVNSSAISIASYHNLGYETYPALTMKHKLRKFIDIQLNKNFDGFTCVSDAVASSYTKHLKLRDVRVIHNVIPIEDIEEINKKQDHLDHSHRDQTNVIMVGRFVPEKAFEYAVEAIELLVKNGEKIYLDIYGEGALKNDIIGLINEKKLSNNIKIHNAISSKELFKFIKNADIFLLSSISEGLPMVVAEAMAIGTPVIATSVGGLVEMIEDGKSGILVPPRDSFLLSKQIERLIYDKELRRYISENAKNRISKKYSPEHVTKTLINFYLYIKNKSQKV